MKSIMCIKCGNYNLENKFYIRQGKLCKGCKNRLINKLELWLAGGKVENYKTFVELREEYSEEILQSIMKTTREELKELRE